MQHVRYALGLDPSYRRAPSGSTVTVGCPRLTTGASTFDREASHHNFRSSPEAISDGLRRRLERGADGDFAEVAPQRHRQPARQRHDADAAHALATGPEAAAEPSGSSRCRVAAAASSCQLDIEVQGHAIVVDAGQAGRGSPQWPGVHEADRRAPLGGGVRWRSAKG